MNKTYYVYKHTNRVNGKVYIGITSQKPRDRWDSGWGYQKNKHFWDAIQKYGWDSFDHEILFSELTPEEAFKKEQELIAEYDSRNYKKGYNCSTGGESGAVGCSGERHHMYGKHHTLESKAKISASKKGIPYSPERYSAFLENLDRNELRERAYRTIVGYNKGKHWSEEVKRKIAKSNLGQKRSDETRKLIGASRKKSVLQFSRDGEFIKEWDCAKTAAIELNIQAGHISKVCKGQRKTAGGFIWHYKHA